MQVPITFQGRRRRRTFWLAATGLWAGFVALFVLLEAWLGCPSTLVLYPPFYWILLALLTRRMHDRGRSSLFLLMLQAGDLKVA